MAEVTKLSTSINLDVDKLLGDWIVCIPGFTLQKYRQLQHSKLSILSKDCLGGLFSHLLGLKILSPFFNLTTAKEEDFLRFLKHPRLYVEDELEFKESRISGAESYPYPVYTIGNVTLNMIHYKNFDEAVAKWHERKRRINWYNILVLMDTNRQEMIEQFDELPYGKKACFVPFKSNLYSAFYIDSKFTKDGTFSGVIAQLSNVIPYYYDLFDILLYGKKTPLVSM